MIGAFWYRVLSRFEVGKIAIFNIRKFLHLETAIVAILKFSKIVIFNRYIFSTPCIIDNFRKDFSTFPNNACSYEV
jgi:hypothetical protein